MSELLGIDWAEAWREREQWRKPPENVFTWNHRAREFSRKQRDSNYADDFLHQLAARAGESVFDMGAGSGTLAIPLAKLGHPVFACDLSPAMLEVLCEGARQAQVDDFIHTQIVDFDAPWSDWQAQGIAEKSADIAIASRSTMLSDLAAGLFKLERVAKRKVAVTMATEYGPRKTRRLGENYYGHAYLPDFIYGMNILLEQGRYPTLSYIDSLKPVESIGDESAVRLIRWAFISWNVPA